MAIRERAKIVIDPDGADETVVTITGDDVYPTRASDTAVTFPQTVDTRTTYFAVTDPASTITVTLDVNDLELCNDTTVISRDNVYTYKPDFGLTLKAHFDDSSLYLGAPAVGATDAILSAVTDTEAEVVITTGITNPDTARNITATAGGTGADIAAIQITIDGTDDAGNTITEDLPAFTLNTTGTVTGTLAFATVTSITIPAHDGTGATTAIGTGAKLGMPRPMLRNNVFAAYLDDVREGTAPTVATSATVSGSTITLNSALDGSDVLVKLV